MISKPKLIRITTVPQSLGLLKGQLRFMNRYFEVIGISSPGKWLHDTKEDEGIEVYALGMTRGITPLKDLISVWQLYRILKKEKPEIVHTHTPKAGTVGMLAAFLAGVPFRLHTIAGLPLMEAKGIKRIILNCVEKITYFCATHIYPNSNGLQRFILDEHFCKPNKVKVIGKGSSNGVDTQFFSGKNVSGNSLAELKEKYELNDKHTVFCFIGRLVGDKGINELVAAFCKLYDFDKSSRLLLVGLFETERDPILSFTREKILNHPGIIWDGWKKDVRPFFALTDIFTFPTYREGFPNVLLQAGAMDLPCIATDINGCNEIIENGLNGLIISSKDENVLYFAMKDLLLNKEKRKMLTLNSRQLITSRYERQFVWDELLKEYENLMHSLIQNKVG